MTVLFPVGAVVSDFFGYHFVLTSVEGFSAFTAVLSFVTVILGYISGCFYPINFFPKALRVLSSGLPSGIARGYLASLITDTASVWQVVAILGYTAILLVISGFIRYRHITEA